MRICALVKQQPDPVTGHLVLLRDLLDAKVYLGCVVDAEGRLQQWVEVWVQTVDALGLLAATGRQSPTNPAMDERWVRHIESFAQMDSATLIKTGFEKAHLGSILLDLGAKKAVGAEENGEKLEICMDDAALAGKGLPSWTNSPHRYLYVKSKGAASAFYAATENAPFAEGVLPLNGVVGNRVALNPGAGLMAVRAFSHLTLETFIDLLSGAKQAGVEHGRSTLRIIPNAPDQNDPAALAGEGWLYLGKHGKSGRLLETLHLKLKTLADIACAAREFTRHQQRPLLNLSPDSFQVKLATAGSGLPTLWTAGLVLSDPGDAVELGIASTQSKYFLPGRSSAASIYRPAVASTPTQGRCSIRVRQVINETHGMVLEGTFVTQERLIPSKNDILWFRLNLGGGGIDCYSTIEDNSALARGEFRFRTFAATVSKELEAQARAAVGIPVANTPFELLSVLSTPSDLYSLAVLCIRTLLTGPKTTLPVALDELLSLAQQAAMEYDPSIELPKRIAGIFGKDERWKASLGPQNLVNEEVSTEEAFDLIPADLWWDILAMIIRLFPALGPDSLCADFGDSPAGAVHKVFDKPIEEFKSLLTRTRSLIVIDWRANREIHAVIRQLSAGL